MKINLQNQRSKNAISHNFFSLFFGDNSPICVVILTIAAKISFWVRNVSADFMVLVTRTCHQKNRVLAINNPAFKKNDRMTTHLPVYSPMRAQAREDYKILSPVTTTFT